MATTASRYKRNITSTLKTFIILRHRCILRGIESYWLRSLIYICHVLVYIVNIKWFTFMYLHYDMAEICKAVILLAKYLMYNKCRYLSYHSYKHTPIHVQFYIVEVVVQKVKVNGYAWAI